VKVKDFVDLFMEDLRTGQILTPECTIDQLPEAKKLPAKCSRCASNLGILPGLFNREGWRMIYPQSNDGMSYLICRTCMDEYQQKIEESSRQEEAPQNCTNVEERIEAIELELTKVSRLKREYMVKQRYYEAQAIRRRENILFSEIEKLRGSDYLREKWKVGRNEDGRFINLINNKG
jgi:hypothetical protein